MVSLKVYLLICCSLVLEKNEFCEREWVYDKVVMGKCGA